MDLNQVTLPCLDYEASVDFYRRLGFVQIVASPPRYARFECASGATFSLHAVTAAPPTETVVYFEVPDVDAKVRQLEEAGIVFETRPVDQRWLWREAYLRDPAGNRLCIYHAGDNRRFPPWRLS
ncbi:MAG TPA: VOC family protein [Paucimonas sp.]|nr:VOC family protein [Paucimonas sp.]